MAMARGPLPPGFRFHPTDVELVLYYLKRKVLGKPLRIQAITELDLYKFSPWDLPEKSCLRSKDLEWYFFCQKDRKYANGRRTNRATNVGYWKTTGRDRPICNDSQTVGMKKTLIFHLGRAPSGNRTNWVMHEYRLEIKELEDAGVLQDAYVLCKVFEKSGAGPKNGEQHGAPYVEEEWEDDLLENSLAPLALVDTGSASAIIDEEKISATEVNMVKTRESSPKPLCQNAPPQPVCRNPPPQLICRNPPAQPLCRSPPPQLICRNPPAQPLCRSPPPQPLHQNLPPPPQPLYQNPPPPQRLYQNPPPSQRLYQNPPPPQPLCRNPPPQPLHHNLSPLSPQPVCQKASSDASGETISQDVDMDTKVETSSEEDDRSQSGKDLDEETCVTALLSLKEKKSKTSLNEVVHRFEQGRRQLQLLLSN